MKKTVIIVSAIAVVLAGALLLSAAGKIRKMDTDYELTFNGSTAVCKATVTGEETVLMEQPYIEFANIGGEAEGVLSDWVWFYGSIPENEKLIEYYFYNYRTGEIIADEDCGD